MLETHVRYLRPAVFDDRLLVHARCLDLSGARFRYEYAVERDGVVIADGWTAHATVDARTLRPTRVPAWLAEAIVSAETLRRQAAAARRRLLLLRADAHELRARRDSSSTRSRPRAASRAAS